MRWPSVLCWGAVRHNGFIPWDDDLDVIMPRKDYEFLLKHMQESLGDKYFLQSCKIDSHYGRFFSKLRKNNTLFLETVDANVENRHHGIFIDIIPYDDCSAKLGAVARFKKKLAGGIESYLTCKRGEIKIPSGVSAFRILPEAWLVRLRDVCMKGKGDYMQILLLKRFPRKMLFPVTTHIFEGKMYCAPHDADGLLTLWYGDYMTLPPVEERKTHNPLRISFDTSGPDEQLED